MSNPFSGLAANAENIQGETDTLGGGSRILPTDIYLMTVTLAYSTMSSGGARGVVLHLETPEGKETRQTLWVTSKKGEATYTDKQGQQHFLPGFNLANSLALLTVGKPLGELTPEDQTVKLYNFDQKKDVPTNVLAFPELRGKKVYAAIFQQTVDKRAKGDDGNYHPTGDTRDENEIAKFFREADKRTTNEILDEAEASFFDAWKAEWAGKVRNRASKTVGRAGAPAGAQRPASPFNGAAAAAKPASPFAQAAQ